jgi:hypothetical protein
MIIGNCARIWKAYNKKIKEKGEMNGKTIKAYKKYFYNEMTKYDYRYTTAFSLIGMKENYFGKYVPSSLNPKESKDYLHKNFLSFIKHDLPVVTKHNNLKFGIPFYAYYVISKEEQDMHYHAHIILNIRQHYEDDLRNFVECLTGNKLIRLKTKKDETQMIYYMLGKGNLVIDSDNEYLLPTGYNLGVDKRHFRF